MPRVFILAALRILSIALGRFARFAFGSHARERPGTLLHLAAKLVIASFRQDSMKLPLQDPEGPAAPGCPYSGMNDRCRHGLQILAVSILASWTDAGRTALSWRAAFRKSEQNSAGLPGPGCPSVKWLLNAEMLLNTGFFRCLTTLIFCLTMAESCLTKPRVLGFTLKIIMPVKQRRILQ